MSVASAADAAAPALVASACLADVWRSSLQSRFTMAATMLTAVDTAPRMIRMEMSGVMKEAPTPFCTMKRVGTSWVAASGLV